MIRYAVSFLSEHTNHPLLMGLFVIAAVFLAGGAVAGLVFDNNTVEGFMTVYAVMAAAMGAFGYAMVFIAKFGSAILRQYQFS